MPATTAVWLVTLVALAFVLTIAGLRAARAMREMKRIKQRVDGYADSPLFASLKRAGDNAERLQLALAELDPLIARARRALNVIRSGPIPPDVVGGVVNIVVELQTLREFTP